MVTWVKSVATAIKNMYQQYIIVIEILDEWTFHSDGKFHEPLVRRTGAKKTFR